LGAAPFDLTSGARLQHVVMLKTPAFRLQAVVLLLATLMTASVGSLAAFAQPTPACREPPPTPFSAAALKPPGMLLTVISPRAGEAIVETDSSESVSLMVDYWGPQLVPAEFAHAIDEYHLAYFLDEDATPYIGTLMQIPGCNPRIIHSAMTRVTFEHVVHSSHGLAVLLTGSNNISVNPPVAARETFTVK
jgi:hypothetical protein